MYLLWTEDVKVFAKGAIIQELSHALKAAEQGDWKRCRAHVVLALPLVIAAHEHKDD